MGIRCVGARPYTVYALHENSEFETTRRVVFLSFIWHPRPAGSAVDKRIKTQYIIYYTLCTYTRIAGYR